jgi:hypothetical protein
MLIEEIKNIPSTKKNLKKFGITIGFVLSIIAVILFYYDKGSFIYFLTIGFSLIILAFSFPLVLKPIQKIWMALALILGWISTRIILSILYFLILTPIGLAAKLFGKDFLNLKFNKSQHTYWNHRDKKPYNNKEESERQF